MDYKIISVMFVQLWFEAVICILTYHAETIPCKDHRCKTEIFILETQSLSGKISIEANPNCDLIDITVVSEDKIYDRILYYFNDRVPVNCTAGLLRDIWVGGNGTACSGTGVFETKGNVLSVRLSSTELSDHLSNSNHSHVDLYFTAFHQGKIGDCCHIHGNKGRCESYDFQCGSGRCIYHALSCSGDNPCGDNSDCKISIPAIITICLGGVCVIGVFAVVVFIICKNCPCCTCGRGQAWAPRSFTPTKALENVQSFTPATVTFVPLRRTWSHN